MSATPSTRLAEFFEQHFTPLANKFNVFARDDGVLRVVFYVDGVQCFGTFDPPFEMKAMLIGLYKVIAWEYRYRVRPELKQRG